MSSERTLVSKLAEIMAEIGHVPKRGVNEFHKYKYVMEADLCDVVREKLAARKIVMIPSVVSAVREKVTMTNKRGETADAMMTDVMVEYTLWDGESGETIKFSMPGCGADTGDKGVYKALTGSDKYALMKAFLIPTGDDPEADPETDARAEGFKRATEAERKELVDKKIADLKERIESHKQQGTAKDSAEVPKRDASPKRLITSPQAKRLYAIAKGNGWSDTDIKEVLSGWRPVGFNHTSEVWREQYDAICKFFEGGEAPKQQEPETRDEDTTF